MTSIDPSQTIGSLVVEHHAAARVFERFGLDYCCGGKRTLLESCASRGVRVEEVVAALELALDSHPDLVTRWDELPVDALASAIEAAHHGVTRDCLAHLVPLADKVFRVHGERHPELAAVRRIVRDLDVELRQHLEKEERVLFPAISALAANHGAYAGMDLRGPIAVMRAEHVLVGELLEELREVTDAFSPPEDACTSYRVLYLGLVAFAADLRTHIHLENFVLFPKVEAVAAS